MKSSSVDFPGDAGRVQLPISHVDPFPTQESLLLPPVEEPITTSTPIPEPRQATPAPLFQKKEPSKDSSSKTSEKSQKLTGTKEKRVEKGKEKEKERIRDSKEKEKASSSKTKIKEIDIDTLVQSITDSVGKNLRSEFHSAVRNTEMIFL